MPENKGLVGLRPSDNEFAKTFVAPPYDVITYGTPLQKVLSERENLIHAHLRPKEEGDARYKKAKEKLDELVSKKKLLFDDEPSYYVYEQAFGDTSRIGVLLACKVTDYKEGKVIRHERTFDDKVKDRLNLRKATGYQIGVVFSVVEDKKNELLKILKEVSKDEPLYSFRTDFNGTSDMDGIENSVWKVPEDSDSGKKIKKAIESEPTYIADGHHRYHCALVLGQKYLQMYISPSASASIQAYDRVVGNVNPADVGALGEKIKDKFEISEHKELEVPEKHSMIFYFKERILKFKARPEFLKELESDPVQLLDCSILQNHILFPHLGLSSANIKDKKYFYYLPGNESGFAHMKKLVESGEYVFAVSLAPVEFSELKAVADKGIADPEIVMPQKSTYFWPKLLSGLFIYKFE